MLPTKPTAVEVSPELAESVLAKGLAQGLSSFQAAVTRALEAWVAAPPLPVVGDSTEAGASTVHITVQGRDAAAIQRLVETLAARPGDVDRVGQIIQIMRDVDAARSSP